MSSGEQEDQGFSEQPELGDLYAILNVSRDASLDTINTSYKNLSRTFHPDKQPAGPSREAAQEIFVSFKNAHDVLADPVLRQVYDDHGHHGVRVVKMTLHSQDLDAIYPTLLRYHQTGALEKARSFITEMMEGARVERLDDAMQLQCSMDFPCTTESTSFLGEGDEPLGIPELESANVSVSATTDLGPKWDITIGTQMRVENAMGSQSGSLGLGFKPVQGTKINAEVDLDTPFKFSLGTTRTLSNRTVVTTTVRTLPSKDLAFSLVSHRALWANRFRGTWALGMGSGLNLHYGLLSVTTLDRNYPRITMKLNAGINLHPVKVSAKHNFSNNQAGHISFAWGPSGVEWKGVVSRALTAYADLSIGIRHATATGLTWLFQLERGDFRLRLPVTVSSVSSPGYGYKILYLSMLTLVVNQAIGEIISDTTLAFLSMRPQETGAESTNITSKSKHDADQQKLLMTYAAEVNMEREKENDGLVILEACYFVSGGVSVDVVTQLRFWVKGSTLCLPAAPKSHLMGFYNIVPLAERRRTTTIKTRIPWWRWIIQRGEEPRPCVPELRVRYTFQGQTCEMTIGDNEPLQLPNDSALVLGPSSRVQ